MTYHTYIQNHTNQRGIHFSKTIGSNNYPGVSHLEQTGELQDCKSIHGSLAKKHVVVFTGKISSSTKNAANQNPF